MGSHRGSKYHQAIPSGTWRRIRNAVLSRDGWRCVRCKRFGYMQVHHVKPLSEQGTNDLSNLVSMCRTCHLLHHQTKPNPERYQWQKLVKALIEGEHIFLSNGK